MNRWLFLACLLLPALTTVAQKTPAKQRADSVYQRLDSTSKRQFHKLDSVKSLGRKFSISTFQHLTDTLAKPLSNPKADSLKQTSNAKVDSLKNMSAALNKPREKIDSINNRLSAEVQSIQSGIDKKQNALTKPITDKEEKINAKIQSVTKKAENKNLPHDVNLPSSEQTKLSLPNTNLPLPANDLSIPSTGLDKSLTEKSAALNSNVNSEALNPESIVSNPLNEIKEIDELKNATDKPDQVSEVSDKAKGYQGDINNIKEGNIEDTKQVQQDLEKKALETDQLKGVNKIKEQEGQMLRQLGDQPLTEEQAKADLVEQSKKMAVDHFATQGEALKGAMEKMATYKQKYASVSGLEELKKRPPNPMKEKPFIERLIPGVSFQYQRQNDYLIDSYVFAGYKHTLRLSSGLGWNQRFARDKNNKYWNRNAAIFGPRAYVDYRIYRGFIIHAEGEAMNTFVPYSKNKTAEGNRQWVCGIMTGLKTEYKITAWLKGTILIQYNLFDRSHKAPYVDRLNSRFGFEFEMKRKKK